MTDASDSTTTPSPGGRPAILVEGLKKAFGKIKALDGVDVSVQPGTIMAMLGPYMTISYWISSMAKASFSCLSYE